VLKEAVQKKTKEIISHIPDHFTLALEDESIFVHDTLIPEGNRPKVITTGSHKKTCVFGTITFDGRQLFEAGA
jgi:hypothetical protein